MSCRRRPPSGRVMPSPIVSPLTSTSSRLPPPRSPAMPLRRMEAGNHAERGVVGLLAPAEHANVGPKDSFGPMYEIRPVDRLARRGGRDHIGLAGACLVRQSAKPPEFLDGARDALGIELPGRNDAASKAGQHLLVEENGRRPRDSLIDDKANGVRPDVDDRYRLTVLEPTLGLRGISWRSRRTSCGVGTGRSAWARVLFSATPRPDRLGLVMKYSWALNGSSPSSGVMRREVPSGNTSKLCWLSIMLPSMIWPSTCSCTVGLVIGTSVSTRRSRLRGIMSAEPM